MSKVASNFQSNDIYIVMPAYNEAKHIQAAIEQTLAVHPNLIVVDDGSSDPTTAIAQASNAHVLTHPINLGKGAALTTGAHYAFTRLKAKAVICMDADEQHSPHDLPLFIEYLQQGYPLVFGVRQNMIQHMPIARRLGNVMISQLVNILFGRYIPDIPCGFKAFSKQAFKKISWRSTGYSVELEIAARTASEKLQYATVPITTIYHSYFRGMTMLDAVAIGFQLIKLRLTL